MEKRTAAIIQINLECDFFGILVILFLNYICSGVVFAIFANCAELLCLFCVFVHVFHLRQDFVQIIWSCISTEKHKQTKD